MMNSDEKMNGYAVYKAKKIRREKDF